MGYKSLKGSVKAIRGHKVPGDGEGQKGPKGGKGPSVIIRRATSCNEGHSV